MKNNPLSWNVNIKKDRQKLQNKSPKKDRKGALLSQFCVGAFRVWIPKSLANNQRCPEMANESYDISNLWKHVNIANAN